MSLTSRLFSNHGLLPWRGGFLQPKELHVGVFYGRDDERMMIEIERPPRVILATDKLLHLWDPDAPMLEELGYVCYERNILFRGSYYALRPWVYLLKARVWVQQRLLGALAWTQGKLWHYDREGFGFRWRDMRLGPGGICRARAAASGLLLQVEAQYTELSNLRMAKDSAYDKGLVRGWEQHAEVVEQFIDDVQKAKD